MRGGRGMDKITVKQGRLQGQSTKGKPDPASRPQRVSLTLLPDPASRPCFPTCFPEGQA